MQTVKTRKPQPDSTLPEGHFEMRIYEGILVLVLFALFIFVLSP